MPAASGAVGRATNDKVSVCHRQAPSKLKRRSPPSPEGRVRGQDGGCLSVPTSGTAACSISRTPAQRGRGCEARRPGPAHCGGGVAGRTCCGCSRPSPPARPSPGTRRPPHGHRGAGASAVGGFRMVPAACLGPGNRRAWPGPWQPSKQQGFLLELVPLPEGQAVELLHAHPEHLLELLRRQVPLQTKRRNPEGAVSSFAAHAREAGPAAARGSRVGLARASCPRVPSVSPSLPRCS